MTSKKNKTLITNYARHVYEKFFDKSRRLMNESGQDFFVSLRRTRNPYHYLIWPQEKGKRLEPCIADADLIVVDNLSCLMRGGPENEGES